MPGMDASGCTTLGQRTPISVVSQKANAETRRPRIESEGKADVV